MVLTEFHKHGVFDAGEEMNGIMDHVLGQVSESKSAEERPALIAHKQVEQP